MFDCRELDGKQARAVMDEMNRSSSPYLIGFGCGGPCIPQGPSRGITSIDGSLHRTRPPITTLRVLLIRRERQTGSSKGASSPDGSQQNQVRYFGFMANVGPTLSP